MIDHMEISQHKDFDVSNKCFLGNVTLGTETIAANYYSIILLRGMKSKWKKVLAHEITSPSTVGEHMKNLFISIIQTCHNAGLRIKAVVSDMGSNNKAL